MTNKIKMFHPSESEKHTGMNPKLYNDAVKVANFHFWFKARKHVILKVFRKYIKPDKKIIEIGAGTGDVAMFLANNGYLDVSISDIHVSGLNYCKSNKIKNIYQFNIEKAPFYKEFDTVCVFDVLEHVDNEKLFVQKAHQMLKKNGLVIITVPAHKWLWNSEDEVSGHKRRYEIETLKHLFKKNKFRIVKVSCFFVSILPLLYLRKLIYKKRHTNKANFNKNRFKINPITNFILYIVLKIESYLINHFSFKHGGSIILVAKKI